MANYNERITTEIIKSNNIQEDRLLSSANVHADNLRYVLDEKANSSTILKHTNDCITYETTELPTILSSCIENISSNITESLSELSELNFSSNSAGSVIGTDDNYKQLAIVNEDVRCCITDPTKLLEQIHNTNIGISETTTFSNNIFQINNLNDNITQINQSSKPDIICKSYCKPNIDLSVKGCNLPGNVVSEHIATTVNDRSENKFNSHVQGNRNSNSAFANHATKPNCGTENSILKCTDNDSIISQTTLVVKPTFNEMGHDASYTIPTPDHIVPVLENCSSNVGSESSSISSSELIDLEIAEHNDSIAGYQDNTLSHSQQSVVGSGNGSSNGGGPTNTSANHSSSSPSGVIINGNTNNGGYISLIPAPVGAITSNHASSGGITGGGSSSSGGSGINTGNTSGEVIDFKHLFEELCPVCGDKVSGYHYGLLTCESCKGFFKRTVQNKKVYTCVAERSCHIDKTQRKRCPYCRFQKCLEVGMKLEAVRADRMRGGRNKFGPMYKRDRARKLQVMRQRQLALQALRTSIGTADMKPGPLSPSYQQAYPNMNIKQEIQIPQVSSLTQSPDSSPSPIAIALGQVSQHTGVVSNPLSGGNGSNNANGTMSEAINRGGSNSCHDGSLGPLQHSESKLCFDPGTHPSSTADSVSSIEPLRVSPMIRDFVQSIDDREWQTQLFALLQKQTYNQVEVDLFELMCKVLDQNLFSQVDWARNTVFFKDLKVDDQMKLLQNSWSDMLVLDHLHQRIHNGLPDETQLNNGQVFNLLGLGLLGVPQLTDYFNELQNKLQDLKFDMGDYVCMKFLILLNPNVRGIINKKTVLEGHENVQAALLDYTLTCYPSVTDKFSRLLNILPEIHAMAARGEEHLYSKHCAGSAPTQTLLMEMLHAKRKV